VFGVPLPITIGTPLVLADYKKDERVRCAEHMHCISPNNLAVHCTVYSVCMEETKID
jgi:hypothetical protein